MSQRPHVDFLPLLASAGVPTTAEAMEAELKKQTEAAGSLISNNADVSPFWRLVRAVVITPAMWLIETLLATHVLPATFAATATATYLDLKAWDVNLSRKPATATQGVIEYVKADPASEVLIPAHVWVTTERINGTIYRVKPTQDVISPAGEAVARVICAAEFPGTAWNLAPGYYCLLAEPIEGILSASNPVDWITAPGADQEDDDALGLRIQTQFSAVGSYHIDAVYRSMLASAAGVRADHIFFEHDGPRGPGTANAYVLMEVGQTPSALLDQLNDYVGRQGYHGHGDDLFVMALPETLHDIHLALWPVVNLTDEEKTALVTTTEQMIRAAFRESADYPAVTRTWPSARFSFSQLGHEIHAAQGAQLLSLQFTETDIVSGLAIPRLQSVEVTLHE